MEELSFSDAPHTPSMVLQLSEKDYNTQSSTNLLNLVQGTTELSLIFMLLLLTRL